MTSDDVIREDRRVRAAAVTAAATLCSGSLGLDRTVHEDDGVVIWKVVLIAYALEEYIRDGTSEGRPLDDIVAEAVAESGGQPQ